MLNSLSRIKYIRDNNEGNKNLIFEYKSNIIYNNKENSQAQINIPRKNTRSQTYKLIHSMICSIVVNCTKYIIIILFARGEYNE